jgi:hypothetical protein
MGAKIVYSDEKVEAFREGKDLLLVYKKPYILSINAGDRMAVDDEVIRMLRMRTLSGKRYFLQSEVGKIIGVSRQMINRRWQVYKREGLLKLLAGEKKKSKMTPQLLDRLAETVVDIRFSSSTRSTPSFRRRGSVERFQRPLFIMPCGIWTGGNCSCSCAGNPARGCPRRSSKRDT